MLFAHFLPQLHNHFISHEIIEKKRLSKFYHILNFLFQLLESYLLRVEVLILLVARHETFLPLKVIRQQKHALFWPISVTMRSFDQSTQQ